MPRQIDTSEEMASTSHGPARKKGLFPVALAVVLVTGVLLAANAVLSFVFIPYGGMTESIWAQYRLSADEDIDTLIVGSSYSMTIDPMALDTTLDSSTFTLATPSQSRGATLVAIRDAYEEHHIKRVIMGTAIGNINNWDQELDYDIAFYLNEAKGRGLGHFVGTYAQMVTGPKHFGNTNSLAALMPWTAFHIDWSLSEAKTNVERKRAATDEVTAQGVALQMLGRGYVNQPGRYDIAAAPPRAYSATDDEYVVDERVMDEFRAIATYCKEHDIAFYLAVTPRPEFSLLRFDRNGGYALLMKQFEERMEDAGAVFFDFTLTRPEFYKAPLEEFRDVGHLNPIGAERFSAALGDVIARYEAGEDVDELFYPHTKSGWKEYVRTVDYIALSSFYPTVGNDGIELELKSWAGPQVNVEYEVSRKLDDGTYEVLRAFAPGDNFTYPTTGHGTVTLLVKSREMGSEEPFAFQCEREVQY